MTRIVNTADFGFSADGTGEENSRALQAAIDALEPPVQAICRTYPGLRFLKGFARSFADHLCYEDEPETIVASAIKTERQTQAYLYVGFPRARHHHLIRLMVEDLGSDYSPTLTTNQGFLSSMGRYVGRAEARQIAEAQGQLLVGALRHRQLFSEDIW